MKEAFDLSEKRQDRKHPNPKKPFNNEFTYSEEDVKEFIKRLKERLFGGDTRFTDNGMIEEIDKLAGDKFK